MTSEAMGAAFQVGNARISTVALLTNPAASKGAAVHAAAKAARRLNERGVDVVHIQGASPEASRDLARQAIADDRADALVVCGGDGLVNLALQEQAGSGKPLGIVPAGTGNDHAREYKIPFSAERAADVIADGFWTTTDLGKMRADDGHEAWFGTIACAGFDSLVSDRTNSISWPRGRSRYNLAIVLEFLNFHSLPARIVLDPGSASERVLGDNVTLCAVGNTRSYGGGMLICPDADHHDGLLDVTVLGRMKRWEVALKFGKIFTGDIRDEQGIEMYRARKVRVEMDGINGYADGDRFAPAPMTVEVVAQAGKYLVPRP